jgi:hypothetical protein
MPVTVDRGEIIHLAGHRRLSPALRDGAPALVPASDSGGRCGWAEFFAALEARGLAVAFDEAAAEAGGLSLVARGAAPARPSWGVRLRAACAESRRFAAALRGRPPAS